jgi:beta-xylosidase
MKILASLGLFFFCILAFSVAQAQENKPLILSGLLLDKSTKAPVVAARIIVPNAGLGATSNDKGVFSIKVMPGDSLVIRAVEYRTAFYKVPTTQTESYSITLTLEESIEALAPIQVYPYSDEQSFKEAFLNIETQTEEIKAMKKNLDKGKLQDAARVTAQDSKSSTQQQLQMQSNQPITNSSLPTLNIFSPTAWRDFSKNLKQSKNEKDRKEKNYKK